MSSHTHTHTYTYTTCTYDTHALIAHTYTRTDTHEHKLVIDPFRQFTKNEIIAWKDSAGALRYGTVMRCDRLNIKRAVAKLTVCVMYDVCACAYGCVCMTFAYVFVCA